jgi:endonuclease YncB( thermonuclease family)
VDRLDEQLSRLVYFAHDRHSELERIRQAAEQVADRDEGGLRGYLEAFGRHVTIERVLDGDTIAVNPGDERIRLLTIDAAERHVATHGSADCGADDAWHALPGLLPVGAEVIVNGLEGEPATDRCA